MHPFISPTDSNHIYRRRGCGKPDGLMEEEEEEDDDGDGDGGDTRNDI